jgi:conjugal transfer/entry exclusion protein
MEIALKETLEIMKIMIDTIGDYWRRKLDKANYRNIQGLRMKEEEGDETNQNCNKIHNLVITKEEEGNVFDMLEMTMNQDF